MFDGDDLIIVATSLGDEMVELAIFELSLYPAPCLLLCWFPFELNAVVYELEYSLEAL